MLIQMIFTLLTMAIQKYADFKIFIKRLKLDIRKYCFSNRTARAWNNLTIETRKAKSVNTFKRLLDADHKKRHKSV